MFASCSPQYHRRVFAIVCVLAAVLVAAPSAADQTVEFDPDQTHGGYDVWMAPLLDDGTFGVPLNLGPNVNTSRRETTPIVSWDGERLFFAARNRADGVGQEDLYICERQGDGWGPAVNMGRGINTPHTEIGPCLLPDGRTLIYSRKDPKQMSFDLIMTVHVEDEWLDPIALGPPVYTPGDERLCTVTADGSQLFFTASRPGGQGSFDLYFAYRDDSGAFSDPSGMGSRVNSPESDYSPGVSPDGTRLYFSTQRDERGNFDIYVAEFGDGGRWGEPYPLPGPVNSRFTEYCPSIGPDGNLYFASDRRTGLVRDVPDFEE